MTHEGNLVVDAVSHGFNHLNENHQNEDARVFDQTTFGMGNFLAPDGWEISEDKFFRDHTAEELARILFVESDADFTVYHSTEITDFFKDGYSRLEKGIKMRDMAPHRTAVYGSVNPLDDDAVDQMEYQVRELDVDAIKLYPVRFREGQSLSLALDDPKNGGRIVEKAAELDVPIAVHKALPFGYAAYEHFELDDLENVVTRYPEVNFEIVHAGFAFQQQTAFLLGRYDNVYANFEVTANLAITQPRKFAKAIGPLLYWAGPEQIFFGTGVTFTHPQPVIEAFWDFQMPEDMQEEYGYPEITDEWKEMMLGTNVLEYLDRDPDEIRTKIEDDQFAREKEELGGLAEPWSSIPGGEGGAAASDD